MKKIAIIGLGSFGSALGQAFAAKGYAVTCGLRDPTAAKNKAALKKIKGNVTAKTVPDAATDAEVVFFATPWPATKQAIQSAGNLTGKIVVDCTNPISDDLKTVVAGPASSGGESVASWATGAKVVKAFNTTGTDNIRNPLYRKQHLTMFICGNHAPSKKTVAALAKDIGFDPVDAGPLSESRQLEAIALLWVHLAFFQKLGTGIALQLIRK
jgi:8-hydroxy-5-deazaflavin:NADPH oxidoreductase